MEDRKSIGDAVSSFMSLGREIRFPAESKTQHLTALAAVSSLILALAAVTVLVITEHWPVGLGLAAVSASMMVSYVRMRPSDVPGDAGRLAEEGWAALHAELGRSRRHNRSFTLVSVPGDVERMAVVGTAAIQPMLRTTDRVWPDDGGLYILLSECDLGQAQEFLERARTRLPGVFRSGQVLLASFPTHAVTAGGLLEALRHEDEHDLQLPA